MTAPILEAGEFRLRPHRAADIDAVVEQARDPESARWTVVPVPYSRADARWFVNHQLSGWQAPPEERERAGFAIADAKTDAFLGSIDLSLEPGGLGGIGFGLHPAARGRGAMRAALDALVDWSFRSPAEGGAGLTVLQWKAYRGNFASRRTVWRSGFRVEGTVRGLLVQRGRVRDGWIGTLRRDDPRTPAHPWPRIPAGGGLREWRWDDAEDRRTVQEAWADPAVRRHVREAAAGLPAREYLLGLGEANASGAGWFAAVADAEGRALGAVGLDERAAGEGGARLTAWLHPAARGRGAAVAAVREALRRGFGRSGADGPALRRVSVRIPEGDAAALALARRCGFTATARERAADGAVLVHHDLLAEEFAG